ncbi:MAG: gliding motility-associated C-terminal domain-containing protein [Bacteroidota bacterium]|nr:gliding motility-associated C-terminal domain-containing protein [Bacteroidota bacterium]
MASDNLGVYFTAARFGTTTRAQLPGLQPQVLLLPPGQFVTDTLNYVYLSRTFVAQGGEQFFTLGNFQPNAATTVRRLRPSSYPLAAHYALDDVSVEVVPPPGLTLALGPDQYLGTCAGAGPATLTAPAGFQSYQWSTGQTTASIQVSQPGRYVLTADYGCGTLRDSVEVRRYAPGLVALLALPPALCPGQTLTLTAASGFRDYQWADGFSGPARQVSQPGRYRLTAHTADGCPVRDSVDVALLPPPLIPPGLPADTLLCAQDALRLTLPAPLTGVSYSWSTGSPDPTLYVAPGTSGSYTLTVRNRCQEIMATIRVRTQDCASLLVLPNIVTPNGDQRNEKFRVAAAGNHAFSLRVFNRWGQSVFESSDYQDQWPASPDIAPGIYYYLLLDNTYGHRYRGWVEVVR